MFTIGLSILCGNLLFRHVLAAKLDALIEERIAEVGDLIEARVRAGVVAGASEVASPDHMRRTMARGPETFLNAIFGPATSGSRDESD